MAPTPVRGCRPRGRAFLFVLLLFCFAALGTAGAEEPSEPASDSEPNGDPIERAADPPPDPVELVPDPAPVAGDQHGTAVAVSGNTVVVGASGEGSDGTASVFVVAPDGTAAHQATLDYEDGEETADGFGSAVAIDGDVIAIGAPGDPAGAGAVIVFNPDGESWSVGDVLESGELADYFGSSVAVGHGWIVVGAPGGDVTVGTSEYADAGLAYIFQEVDGGGWSLFQQLQSSDPSIAGLFGTSVAIDDLDDVIVIGAPGEAEADGVDTSGAAYIYTLVNGQWVQAQRLSGTDDGDLLGTAVDVDGGTVVVGAPGLSGGGLNGGAFVYDLDGNVIQLLEGAPGQGSGGSGGSVAIDGGTIVLGGGAGDQGNNGRVDVWRQLEGGTFASDWTLGGTTDASLGRSVAVSGGLIAVGAPCSGDGGQAFAYGAPDPATPPPGISPTAPGVTSTVTAGSTVTTGGEGGDVGEVNGATRRGPRPTREVNVPLPPRPAAEPRARHRQASADQDGAPANSAAPASVPAESNPERSTLADRLLSPAELDLSAENLAEGGILAFLLVALLYLPVMIFNKVTERNHDTIGSWLDRPRSWFAWIAALIPFSSHPLATLAGGVLASTALFAFVEPHFPSEDGSLQYLLGMLLGFTVVSVVFFSTWRFVVHRLEPESTGHWRIYPVYILLAAAFVVFARLAHFLPGVVLGTVAEYEPAKPLSKRTAGIRVVTTYGALIILGLIAWFAWIPVAEAAEHEHAGSLTLVLDSMLAITFVSSLETVAFGLIPMSFLDGHELFSWHKGLWALLWGSALFWFALVVLNPALSTYHEVEGVRAIWLVLLFSSLMIVAISTWGYFRIREARLLRVEQG